MLSLTAALFDTEMTNARITDPTNPGAADAGRHRARQRLRVRRARPSDRRTGSILAGYTYLDPTAIGLVGPGVHGPIPNTAHNQANLWTIYDFDDGFTVGGGLNYLGRVNAGTDNATVPGSIVVAHVPVARHLRRDGRDIRSTTRSALQLNGYNLTDEYYFVNSYFTRPGENHTVPAPGRTFLLTLNASL